jgi:hypothetical protein
MSKPTGDPSADLSFTKCLCLDRLVISQIGITEIREALSRSVGAPLSSAERTVYSANSAFRPAAEVDVTASAVVAAFKAYARIIAAGE